MPVLLSKHAILSLADNEDAVHVSADTSWVELIDQIRQVSVVCIDFPTPTDGRGFTIARLLREQYGFTGALRAVGSIIVDQIPLLARCGFDQFVVDNENQANTALKLLQMQPPTYQPCADGPSAIPPSRDRSRISSESLWLI